MGTLLKRMRVIQCFPAAAQKLATEALVGKQDGINPLCRPAALPTPWPTPRVHANREISQCALGSLSRKVAKTEGKHAIALSLATPKPETMTRTWHMAPLLCVLSVRLTELQFTCPEGNR